MLAVATLSTQHVAFDSIAGLPTSQARAYDCERGVRMRKGPRSHVRARDHVVLELKAKIAPLLQIPVTLSTQDKDLTLGAEEAMEANRPRASGRAALPDGCRREQ